eukprot:scaffold2696_cov333-Pavlova_lutheri.AAC.28
MDEDGEETPFGAKGGARTLLVRVFVVDASARDRHGSQTHGTACRRWEEHPAAIRIAAEGKAAIRRRRGSGRRRRRTSVEPIGTPHAATSTQASSRKGELHVAVRSPGDGREEPVRGRRVLPALRSGCRQTSSTKKQHRAADRALHHQKSWEDAPSHGNARESDGLRVQERMGGRSDGTAGSSAALRTGAGPGQRAQAVLRGCNDLSARALHATGNRSTDRDPVGQKQQNGPGADQEVFSDGRGVGKHTAPTRANRGRPDLLAAPGCARARELHPRPRQRIGIDGSGTIQSHFLQTGWVGGGGGPGGSTCASLGGGGWGTVVARTGMPDGSLAGVGEHHLLERARHPDAHFHGIGEEGPVRAGVYGLVALPVLQLRGELQAFRVGFEEHPGPAGEPHQR